MAVIPDRRFLELDACRGIAIIMMVLFHLVFDLSFFSLFPVDVQHGFWRYFGYATAIFFVSIAGVAVMIRGSRVSSESSGIALFLLFFKRGFFLIGIGIGITLATYVFLQGQGYVVFGILHLIGVSTILAPFFFRFRQWVVVPGSLLILLEWLIPLPNGPFWLIWIGVTPPGFYSVDYTPLIPWFGIFLIGMGIGSWVYPEGKRLFQVSDRVLSLLKYPALLGRHSLLIYLVHQPIIIAILAIFSGKIPGL